MAQRFKYESVDYSVGWLALVTLVLVVGGVVQTGAVQGWLDPGVSFSVRMPDKEGSLGLREGADVVVLGAHAGRVTRVELRDRRVIVRARLDASFARLMTTNWKIYVRKSFVVAGDAYLEIEPGDADPLEFTDETTGVALIDEDLVESVTAIVESARVFAEGTLPEVQARLPETLDNIEGVTESLSVVLARLADERGDMAVAMSNMRTLSDEVANGDGPLAMLIRNVDLTADIQKVVAELFEVSQNTDELLVSLNEGAEEMPALLVSLRAATDDLRATLAELRDSEDFDLAVEATTDAAQAVPRVLYQTEQTLAELDRLLRAMQSHWLVGGGRAPADPGLTLPSGEPE